MAVSGDGKLESSVCQEVHLFRPLSTSSSGATTIVKQHVKLVDEKKSASNVNIFFFFVKLNLISFVNICNTPAVCFFTFYKGSRSPKWKNVQPFVQQIEPRRLGHGRETHS